MAGEDRARSALALQAPAGSDRPVIFPGRRKMTAPSLRGGFREGSGCVPQDRQGTKLEKAVPRPRKGYVPLAIS